MAISPVTMPQLGESVTEGTIGKWLKQPGDKVEKYESIAEVITDKVNAEIPSPVAGVIKELKVEEGATVPVGTEILTIDDGGPASDAPSSQPAPAAAQAEVSPPPSSEIRAAQAEAVPAPSVATDAPPPAPAPAPAAAQPQSGGNGAQAPQLPADMSAAVAQGMPGASAQMYSGSASAEAPAGGVESEEEMLRRRSTPAVRRLAEEHNVDLSQLKGSGLGGRVTKEDVLQYVAKRGSAPAAAPAPAQPSAPTMPQPAPAPTRQPSAQPTQAPAPAAPTTVPSMAGGDVAMGLTPMRRAIAEHMVRSVATSPHAWTTVEIDMTNVVRYRDSIKTSFEQREGIPISYYTFFVKAIIDSIKDVPQVNSVWNDEQGVVLKRDINVGIPVDIGEGLIVPVIHNADSLSVTGLARKIYDLATRARANKLTLPDIQGGTITVNNTGALGVVMTHSIINQPQACLITMESIVKRPVVIDDAIAIRSMMFSTIALDHRILDGAVGAKFLRAVKERMENFSAENAGL
jgi:2-oxoisovalerate dehydrogenase E2 component (dihydrolipoyl transacylase)